MSSEVLSTRAESEENIYGKFGRESAARADGQPGLIKESLNVLYQEIVKIAGQDEAGIHKRIQSLEAEVLALENQKKDLGADKASLNDKIADAERQIEDIENAQGNPDFIPFVVGAFITILLTLYLWAFYSASGYAAYAGVPEGTNGFAGIFASLSEAFSEGGTLTIIVVLFPTVFLGLGFLIHDGLEKKRYGFIAVLLFFTFFFDVIIGFMITKHLHQNDFNADLTSEEWRNGLVLNDLNFYFILASGFVCYVMWGFLLNYTLIKWNEIQPPARIRKLKEIVLEYKKGVKKCEGDIIACDSNIALKARDINAYKNGQVDIDIPTLKAYIGHFMSGWSAWTVLMKDEEAQNLIKEADQGKERWLEEKIGGLKAVPTGISSASLAQKVSVN